ncbi:MAG: hypothetical protein KKB50_08740 [Planctomycetes bacterium]|nr:hypothetical protein [Planctomycetota bacterium]
MGDIRERAHQDRNWLQRVLHALPGFHGYLGKEERRESDKLLREHLATKLVQLRRRLDPVIQELTSGSGLLLVGEVDRVKTALDRLAARLRHAEYGYSGLFDAVKIREAELDRLYEFDAALLDRIEQMGEVLGAATAAAGNSNQLRLEIGRLRTLTREFDEHIDGRMHMLADTPSNDAAGR